ncbi:MAG TPA: DEAD/DEAH box helicase, partial [Bacteroidia bacterium]
MKKDSPERLLFADVILPLAVPNLYTYSIPSQFHDSINIGQRVVVQFGKKKLYSALVQNLHSNKPTAYEAKPVESILDNSAVTNEKQFKLWKWMADYYMCTIGEVMNAALPSGLKLSSETKIILNPVVNDSVIADFNLSKPEHLVYDALHQNNLLTFSEAEKILANRPVHATIKSLLEKNVILIYEEISEKFKPKTEEYIRLSDFAKNESNLQQIFDSLEKRAFKQLELLMEFIHQGGQNKDIRKKDLLNSNYSASTLQELIKKNIVEITTIETGRFSSEKKIEPSKNLSSEQEDALHKIREEWKAKDVTLLHGVTSSGKTELYIKLIEEAIQNGKQVLYLLPEIALTTHVVSRINKYFGGTLGVYHSRFNENERVEVWNEVNKFSLSQSIIRERGIKFQAILGARSALFLPFSDLGLVIVDEEHDASYKQYDPAPRYEARDAAIMLAKIHNAKVLLGSATPSIESYYNAKEGKYGFSELKTRFGGVQLPEILIADVKEAMKRKKMKSHFSPLLLENIQQALEKNEQVI